MFDITMNTSRRALTGSIHKIREFELEKVCLVEEFDILQIVGEGWFGKILLVEHRASDTEVVLKALPKPYVTIRDFYREFHYSLHLGAHRNIVTTFDVAFETAGFYVFCQEYAPLGDLTSNMLDTGIGEIHTKRVAKQLSAALEHIHQRDLVHRDVKLDNILIFKTDFSRIKLCDFGETRKVGSDVRRRNEWLPYSPPEVLSLAMDSSYQALVSHDIWQFGIVIFICLTGCLPWQKAAFDDPRYTSYFHWYNSANPLKRQPKLWKMLTTRAQKLFKKFAEPKKDKRAKNFQELARFLDDRWLAKGYTDRVAGGDIDELCPSMYSFHSDPNEKNILLRHFLENGIETTVDRQAKKQRIREWIQNSVIEEADEEDESNYEPSAYEDSEGELEDTGRTRNYPIDESHRVKIRYDTEKHINPRTGEVIEGATNKTSDKNLLSYDVQGIEPVAPAHIVRRYGVREETSGNSSTKDSAYGSMEGRIPEPIRSSSSFRGEMTTNVKESYTSSTSRSISSSSIQPNKSPLTIHAQRIQKTDEVFSQEIQNMHSSSFAINSANPVRPNRGQTSNAATQHLEVPLHRVQKETNQNLPMEQQNTKAIENKPVIPMKSEIDQPIQRPQISTTEDLKQLPNNHYVSLKDSAYDTVTSRNDVADIQDSNNTVNGSSPVPESPYVSMMNIVQGQIQINPYGNEANQNIVNVSVTPVKGARYQRYSSYS